MKPKFLVTIVLLLFVVASIAYLVIKETTENTTKPDPISTRIDPINNTSQPISSESDTNKPAVVVYYFHGNARCATCRNIETYTKEAIDSKFATAIKDGQLRWRVVNIEDSANEHFVQDFQLATRTVVLERSAAGKQQEWKNLQRVWELVRGDKEDFLNYIQQETSAYLEASGL